MNYEILFSNGEAKKVRTKNVLNPNREGHWLPLELEDGSTRWLNMDYVVTIEVRP